MRRYLKLARWIRGKRLERGFPSAMKLAEKAGVSPGYISLLEHGRYRPRGDTAAKIASALDLSPVERTEFLRLAALDSPDRSVREAFDDPPGLKVWSNVARAMLAAPHPVRDDSAPGFIDETMLPAVGPVAALLTWIHASGPRVPARTLNAVRKSFYHFLGGRLKAPAAEPLTVETPTVTNAARFLPMIYRAHVLSDRRVVDQLAKPLTAWAAEIPLFHRTALAMQPDLPRLWVEFSDAELHERAGVEGVPTQFTADIHDMLTLAELWAKLGLDAEYGDAASAAVFPNPIAVELNRAAELAAAADRCPTVDQVHALRHLTGAFRFARRVARSPVGRAFLAKSDPADVLRVADTLTKLRGRFGLEPPFDLTPLDGFVFMLPFSYFPPQ